MKEIISLKNRAKYFIQCHDGIYEVLFTLFSKVMTIFCFFTPIKENRMLFCSLSGRNYDDSPKAIYEEILKRKEFINWDIVWAFTDPDKYSLQRGRCVRFGGINYWYTLFSSKVWIGNGGIDKGLDLVPSKRVVVNTWHGSVLKKSEGEENSNAILKKYRKSKKLDNKTIRCAQNDFDIETYMRLFCASSDCFLKSGLPRNDILLKYNEIDKKNAKESIGIPQDKKVILYMPTYREYLVNDSFQRYISPPISLDKWENQLGNDYVFLIRAHYAVTAALDIQEAQFCKDVSRYEPLSELYLVADVLITDYSSCFYDYAILGKPFFCFAYDKEEYEEKRGLYLKLEDIMPCGVYTSEDTLIEKIRDMDYNTESEKIEHFRKVWVPYCGNASTDVVNKILDSI